jgi:4'-phosphopantetheinyl transferase
MGGYLEVSPAVITFRRGRGGKPHLAGRFAGSALGFNYSHSGDRVLIAVAAGWEVGVDIEWVHSGLAIEEILESFLTRDEWDAIDCLAGATRRERAFRIWARKEAVVKAVGAGLRLPMTAIEVGSAARAESRPIVVQASDRCRRRLVLSDVCCPPGYVAAAAVNTPREADASEQDVD